MKTLNAKELNVVSGGMNCKEALIYDLVSWEDIDITQYCTKEQFTTFALNSVDLIYTEGFEDYMTEEMIVDYVTNI